ncbi:MAG: LysR family transcriptional regulator [Acidimicrobiales bacterium]
MGNLQDLELRHLTALATVAEQGTFARAAAELGFSQSAVSQQIAALERIIGEPVFNRPGGPRPVELTPIGVLLLDRSRSVLAGVAAVRDDIVRFRDGAVGRLAVGAYQSVATSILPELVARLHDERPDLDLRVENSDHDEELYEAVLGGAIDLSFGTRASLRPGLDVIPLLVDPYVVVARPDQFPAGPIDARALNGIPLVGQPRNSCQVLNEAGLVAAGCRPTYVFRSADNGTVAAMVRSGLGPAVLPLLCVERDDPRLVIHALEPGIPPREVVLVSRTGRPLAPSAVRFVALAREICADLARRFEVTMAGS